MDKIKVLMVGVSKETKGGMWTVVDNYINNSVYNSKVDLEYIPTSTIGNGFKKLLFSFKGILRVFFEIILFKPDLVHIHLSERGSVSRKFLISIMCNLFNVPYIVHMHGAEFEVWYESLRSKYTRWITGYLLKNAKSVVLLGNYMVPFCQLNFPGIKIEVIYNAVKNTQTIVDISQNSEILYFAEISKRKGIKDLLLAVKQIEDEFQKNNLKLIVYGPLRENDLDIEEEIVKLNLQEIVKYNGWLEPKNKIDVFSRVMLNVLPSYNEGLPMTILELMSVGVPTISTRVAAIPEAITSNYNGIIIEPGDIYELKVSLKMLINNLELLKVFGDNSIKVFKERFDLSVHVTKVLELYGSTINEKN